MGRFNYEGYQFKINGTTFPCVNINLDTWRDVIIETGSYSISSEYPLLEEWTDLNGTIHRQYGTEKKTTISFTIKERSLAQQNLLVSRELFTNRTNLTVEYYDDETCQYKTGRFFMDGPDSTVSIATKDNIYYGKMKIKLVEY